VPVEPLRQLHSQPYPCGRVERFKLNPGKHRSPRPTLAALRTRHAVGWPGTDAKVVHGKARLLFEVDHVLIQRCLECLEDGHTRLVPTVDMVVAPITWWSVAEPDVARL
jgi:hypothetical protein